MTNILNRDFTEFIDALTKAGVEYLLVGGYAVIFYGYNRTTGDLDIWVYPTKDNYQRLSKAFTNFGMSMFDMKEEKILKTDYYDVFTFGRPPICIEILTAVKGLEFHSAYKNSKLQDFDGCPVRIIDFPDLVRTKKAVNRYKDRDDLEHLGNQV